MNGFSYSTERFSSRTPHGSKISIDPVFLSSTHIVPSLLQKSVLQLSVCLISCFAPSNPESIFSLCCSQLLTCSVSCSELITLNLDLVFLPTLPLQRMLSIPIQFFVSIKLPFPSPTTPLYFPKINFPI